MTDIGSWISLFQANYNPGYSFAGLVVGILIGLTGVGGGSLMTPILVLIFGINPTLAVGTDLLFASATKLVGTAVHGFKNTIEWKIVGLLALGSLPASMLVIYFVNSSGHSAALSNAIKILLGYSLFITAALVLARAHLAKYAKSNFREGQLNRQPIYTFLVGLFVGALVAFTSVGAGAIGVTALILLYPVLPTLRIVGSDIAHAVPLTLVAGMGYLVIGNVDVLMLGALLIGSIPGIMLGSWLAPKVSEKILRYLLAGVLAFVGFKLVFSR
ncbi:MAG: Uncharacterized protein FD163_2384 [Hyphomonadaceae bacterium]|nr:MAG: Uncharacterized protein FD128_216 [Hyphomonadaceae bacterium]KAF0183267.1 MAG: Uncharacterized protein FD163_2384 [Hyphomonadaceae bacterium]